MNHQGRAPGRRSPRTGLEATLRPGPAGAAPTSVPGPSRGERSFESCMSGAPVADGAPWMPPAGLDYYAALARALTPADMAQLAARRAYRMARRRLYRRDGCEPFEAVLTSHGA